MHYSFRMATNFVNIDEIRTKLATLHAKKVVKVRKDKQDAALQFFEVNKLSKDVGELKIFSTALVPSGLVQYRKLFVLVHSARALFVNQTLTTVSLITEFVGKTKSSVNLSVKLMLSPN